MLVNYKFIVCFFVGLNHIHNFAKKMCFMLIFNCFCLLQDYMALRPSALLTKIDTKENS